MLSNAVGDTPAWSGLSHREEGLGCGCGALPRSAEGWRGGEGHSRDKEGQRQGAELATLRKQTSALSTSSPREGKTQDEPRELRADLGGSPHPGVPVERLQPRDPAGLDRGSPQGVVTCAGN